MGLFKRCSRAYFERLAQLGDFLLLAGGNWDNGASYGALCLNANNGVSNANANIGSRQVFSKKLTFSKNVLQAKQTLPLGKTYTFQNNGLSSESENSIVGNTRTAR